jgi:diguanylate cyclase (GGDEF)-like protein
MGIGVSISIVIMTLFFLSIDTIENKYNQRQRLEVLERFLRFQSRAETIINESINLLEGYMTYIKINPDISEEDSNKYLDNLLSTKKTLIRNIGIMEDTTVIWNYPREGNKEVIGVDLTTITSQKDDIIKVKKTLKRLFIGPVNLIQGGVGFIARLPIVFEGEYKGQISVVLDGDKYLEYMDVIAEESKLNVTIYNLEDFPLQPFHGDSKLIDREGLVLNIEILNNKWKVVIEPLHGWKKNKTIILAYRALSILIGLIIGIFLHIIFYTRYQLNYQAMNDQLTGLNNRYFLDYYYQTILKKAEANNEFIGLFLIDINHFKAINDNYGHKVGDLVLIEFAKRIQAIGINKKRGFRIGGDEFLILVSDINELQDLEYAFRIIREETLFRFKYQDNHIEVVPSIGLATYPIDGDTLERIMNVADSRMYEEKRLSK